MGYYNLTWAVVLVPLGGCLFAWLPQSPRVGGRICILGTAVAFVLSLIVLGYRLGHISAAPYQSSITFWSFLPEQGAGPAAVPTFTVQVGVLIDGLSAAVLPVVALVSLLVQVYSTAYMKNDTGYRRFFMVIGFFTFCMLGLVASPNLFSLYILWEGVGLCSFLLIGHWWHRPEAVAAAKKAFLVTRIGDLGLFLAIVFIFAKFASHVAGQTPFGQVADTFSFSTLATEWQRAHAGLVPGVGGRTLVVIALLVLMGAVGKSAQLPLHTWLPDAMEGPTPISALIHAATMVAAGAYLVARMYPLFIVAPHVLTVVALLGASTAVFGAVVALAHTDLKRIIAYSTISHLGLMFTALGVGAFSAAVFHLFTHAWFKALLFLAAGNVIQAYGTNDIREMGGAWSRMRATSWAMLLGCLSAAGVVGFAGFWSKDSIVAGVLRNTLPNGSHLGGAVKAVLVLAMIAVSLLGAMYPLRLFLVAFLGDPARRRGFQPQRVREAPAAMLWPVLLLAGLSCLAGFIGIAGARFTFGNFVYAGSHPQNEPFNVAGVALGGCLALAGVALAWFTWGRPVPQLANLPRRAAGVARVAAEGFWIDAAWTRLVVRGVVRPAEAIPAADETITDAVVDAVSEGMGAAAAEGRRLQTGRLQVYLLSAAACAVLLAGGFTLAATGHFPGVGATR